MVRPSIGAGPMHNAGPTKGFDPLLSNSHHDAVRITKGWRNDAPSLGHCIRNIRCNYSKRVG